MALAGSNAWARYATAGAIITAGSMAFAVTAAGNYAYGLSQGTDAPFLFSISTKQVSAYACLAADIAAAGLATGATILFRAKNWRLGFGAAGLCIIATVFAFFNTLGFLGMERASAEALRKHGASGYEALADDLARMKRERGWVPQARPADVVLALISEKELDPIYVRAKQCTAITLPDSRKFCDELQALRTEAASAGAAARLDTQIRETQNRLNGTVPVVSSDFLAASLRQQFNVPEDETGVWQPFAKASVLCLLAVFCFAFAEAVLASKSVQASPSNLPVIEVVRPPEVPSFQAPVPLEKAPDPKEDAPYLEPEKPLETAIGQAPDSIGRNVTKMLPKPVTAEQGVAEWARQMPEGRHFLHGFKLEYQAYAKRRNIKTVRLHSLASVLEGLGYQKGKEKGGKVYVIFPKVLASHPRVVLA